MLPKKLSTDLTSLYALERGYSIRDIRKRKRLLVILGILLAIVFYIPRSPEFKRVRKVILITDYYLSIQYYNPERTAGIPV